MARRGPKPEPASVKLAKGNSGRRPIGEDSAVQAADSGAAGVAPPSWLKGKGLDVWNRIAPRLIGQRLLSQTDADTFARYCKSFARWHKMQTFLDTHKEFYESDSAHGKLWRVHPAFMIADRIERYLIAAEDRFGLNPAERQRIFAARAVVGTGDLFGPRDARERPAGAPAAAAEESKGKSAIGLLN